MEELTKAPFKIAVRTEGNYVNAYIVDTVNPKNDMLLLASIANCALDGEEIRNKYHDFLAELIKSVVENAVNHKVNLTFLKEEVTDIEKGGTA